MSHGEWSRLFRATLSRRSLSAFHLIDIHRQLAGFNYPAARESWLKRPDSPPAAIDCADPLVTIQLGANNPLRIWNAENFAATVQWIIRAVPNAKFALVGSREEMPLAVAFENSLKQEVFNLVGRTTVSELAGVIASSKIVLSGDTGTIHLAAALNIPAVGIYLGMARADDTAPYRAGSIIFEPRRSCYPCPENHRCGHVACHSDIPPQKVANAIIERLRQMHVNPESGENYRSRITEFDEQGFLTLAGKDVESFRRDLREFWLNEFVSHRRTPLFNNRPESGEIDEIVKVALTSIRKMISDKDIYQNGKANDLLKNSLAAIDRLATQRDEAGLLAHLFQLELEHLLPGVRAAEQIEAALINVQRRLSIIPKKSNSESVRLKAAV